MIKIKRKRLFEEGEQNIQQQPAPQNQAPQQTNNAQQQPAQNNAPQQQPVQNNNQQQNAQQNNAQQPAQNNNQQQNNQQNQNNAQQQSQQDPAQEKIQQEVSKFMDDFKAKWSQNNIFWALQFNLPEALAAACPEFSKNNQNAAAGIAAWEAFKDQPSEDSFNEFMNKLTEFAKGPETQEQQNTQAVQQ